MFPAAAAAPQLSRCRCRRALHESVRPSSANKHRGFSEHADGLQEGLHHRRVRAGEPMAFTLESERILQAAVAGLPRVAMTIAEIPTALRERALEAVARSYQRTVRELGHTETDAQIWISAVMLRLRSGVAEQRKRLERVGPGSKTSIKYANTAGPDS
jgi:hypothetical protein